MPNTFEKLRQGVVHFWKVGLGAEVSQETADVTTKVYNVFWARSNHKEDLVQERHHFVDRFRANLQDCWEKTFHPECVI